MHTSNTASNSNSVVPRIILTTGEPSGIGPDIVIDVASRSHPAQLVCLTDPALLSARAAQLSRPLKMIEYAATQTVAPHQAGTLPYLAVTIPRPVTTGQLDPANAGFVLDTISQATRLCLAGEFDAMVTGPVNKAVINESGQSFSGHTEFIAELCGIDQPVMMLMNRHLRVALVTTHLPLARVPAAITSQRLKKTLCIVNEDLHNRLGISKPAMLVCGLNPHAGETGHLGTEENAVIIPVISELRSQGLDIRGPAPADTAFTAASLKGIDVVVAMYHDQGLPVLKSVGFGETVNVTLGLPIIRTSVDHGTALALAGTGMASAESLQTAIEAAIEMVRISSANARTA